MTKTQNFAMPGDVIANSLEFVAGKNTFEDEQGNVVADQIGTKELNESEREAKILQKTRKISKLEIGAIVLGKVNLVKDNLAVITLIKSWKGNSEIVIHDSSAVLMISKISTGYLRDIKEVMKIGDIIKAEVITATPFMTELTTAKPELGVMNAFCSRCRKELHLSGTNMKCLSCGSVEARIVSNEYYLK
ncbi:MAG: exosome complex RNA-binding protein Csl4 [Candidatus Diapherotrites archaeon]|nr:exosome complex RNA-binding protein Csl4 [Candidatus Diapherotrites archaeon]